MISRAQGAPWSEIEAFIEAFELAQARAGHAEIKQFLPDPSHPRYLDALCELVRIDLEYGWDRGKPRSLSEYRAEFPELFADSARAQAIEFEESRLRLQAQDDSSLGSGSIRARANGSRRFAAAGAGSGPAEIDLGLFGVASSWASSGQADEVLQEFQKSEPVAASKLARATARLPELGADFLGFRIVTELGRGAFGRVYLARQGDLANRPVALKVGADMVGESQTLAQLQHTNIVPIHSIHRSGPLQAVCMPYFGATTLADVLSQLRAQEGLPDSGEGLLSTLDSRLTASDAGGSAAEATSEPAPMDAHHVLPPVVGPPPALRAMLRGFDFVQGVLWVGTRLTEGLAHAHDRGILHRDLKPANILFADDGQPMLLDFNLAADTKLRSSASAALLGGTLPYMAPEQIEALAGKRRPVDERSDIYALGIILFELLTEAHPFPVHRAPVAEMLPRMLADRLADPPRLRPINKAVSPAVESIIRKCLQPNPDRRYCTARQLLEDLQRQIEYRPLKYAPEPSLRERVGKWIKRHPQLCSSFTVGAIATVLLISVIAGYSVRMQRLHRLEATQALQQLEQDLSDAQLLLASPDAVESQRADGLSLCAQEAKRYGVLDSAGWKHARLVTALGAEDRTRLSKDLGGLLMLWARAEGWKAEALGASAAQSEPLRQALRLNQLAQGCFADGTGPRALWIQRSKLERLAGDKASADEAKRRAAAIPAETVQDQFWLVAEQVDSGHYLEAIKVLKAASHNDSRESSIWLLLGQCYGELRMPIEAERAFGVGLALEPRALWGHFQRGYLRLHQKNYAEAIDDFTQELAIRPGLMEARFNRAVARLALKDAKGAIADLDVVLKRESAPTRVYFARARAKRLLGDFAGAREDREQGLKRVPNDELSWNARGVDKIGTDPRGAIADFEEAFRRNPHFPQALENKASVLSEQLGKTAEAVAILDEAVARFPDYVFARKGRGVLLGRLGKREAALADAEAALVLDRQAHTLYQVAGIFALTSKQVPADRKRAFQLLASAFLADPSWVNVARTDPDLDPVRSDPEFRTLLQAASAIEREARRNAGPSS